MRWIKTNRLHSKTNDFNLNFLGFKFLLFQICVKLETAWQYLQAPERKWCTGATGQEAVPGSHSYLGTNWGHSRTLAPNTTAIWTGKKMKLNPRDNRFVKAWNVFPIISSYLGTSLKKTQKTTQQKPAFFSAFLEKYLTWMSSFIFGSTFPHTYRFLCKDCAIYSEGG